MDFMNTFRLALRALARNKMRSALTMLGIVIGVASVIALVAVGTGSSAAVQASIDRLGSNSLFVLPASTVETCRSSRTRAKNGTSATSTPLLQHTGEAFLQQEALNRPFAGLHKSQSDCIESCRG